MGESKPGEKLNLECNNIFIDKNQSESELEKMNESIAPPASIIDETLLIKNHSHYEAQVKEEALNFFTRDEPLSPMSMQNKIMKEEYRNYDDNFPNDEIDDESDEETIATFITAAGQQLALYGVEDSEEIFAVAVYDESGLPPTDFQFLMKSDVEKLIGEGAIRTVKKPSQLKNQVYAIDGAFNIIDNEEPPSLLQNSEKLSESPIDSSRTMKDALKPFEKGPAKFIEPPKNSRYMGASQLNSNMIYEDWSDNVILFIQNDAPATAAAADNNTKQEESPAEINEIDNEVMEKSTVQYILSDDPPDSSDLTLDDIEQVLNKNNHVEDQENSDLNEFPESVSIKLENYQNSRDSDDLNDSIEEETKYTKETCSESADFLRIKRPRKQQLTSVNRTDSEIIIQAAMITEMDNNYDEEYDKRKKRGKRKKKKETRLKSGPYLRTRRRTTSSSKGGKKTYRIEVIDIDMDDVSREIITLDGKEKGSSDKENEVIMVGDSDDESKDEEVEENDSDDSDYTVEKKLTRKSTRKIEESLNCRNCDKKFRGKNSLLSHSRICKSKRITTERIRRGPVRSVRLCKPEINVRGKKDYECKVCHERFDVVVALARHARAMHSKKRNLSLDEVKKKQKVKVKSESPIRGRTRSSLRDGHEEKKVIEKRKKKFNGKIRRKWGNPCTKKINCRDCGRWFPGLALLLAHSLQHATKKIVSEKSKVRRCQLCKKIFTSRFLYICHMRMHSNIVPLRKTSTIKQSKKTKKTVRKQERQQKS